MIWEIAKVSTQISSNHWAWATGREIFTGTEKEVNTYINEMWERDWEEVPEGCSLGYQYWYRRVG